jgi:hypothetical protein
MTIYNKEMKKTIRGVEDTYSYTKRKQRRLYALGRGLQREIGERGARNYEEERRHGEKIQRQGKCRGEKTDGMD